VTPGTRQDRLWPHPPRVDLHGSPTREDGLDRTRPSLRGPQGRRAGHATSASCTPPPAWSAADDDAAGRSPRTGRGPRRSPGPGSGSARCRTPADQHGPATATCGENPWGQWKPPAPGPPAGPPSYPDAKIPAVAAILGILRGSQRPA
jgi:hypothetical protein